jgi:hypothetical protein
VFLSGSRKTVPEVQTIFVDAILGLQLGECPPDERIYDYSGPQFPDSRTRW